MSKRPYTIRGTERFATSQSQGSSEARRIDLLVDEAEITRRLAGWTPPAARFSRGYGKLGSLANGLQAGDGRLRAGTVFLGAVERGVYVCPIRRTPEAGPLPMCIAPGDSGGPLWATAADGTTRLVGVNSYVARVGGKARYVVGEESGHTRVSLYLDWIAEVAGTLDGGCTMPGCQPPH